MSRPHLATSSRALLGLAVSAAILFAARTALASPHYYSFLPQYSATGAQIVGGGINNSDTVAFQTTVGGVTTVYTAYGGHLTKIADSTQTDTFVNDNDMFNIHTVTSTFQNIRSVGIDDSGRAYFVTTLASYYDRVVMSSGGQLSHAFDYPDFGWRPYAPVAAYSDSGVIVATSAGNSIVISNGTATRISNGPYAGPYFPVVNNGGMLADASAPPYLYVTSGSTWTVGLTDHTNIFEGALSINNSGSLLFSEYTASPAQHALQLFKDGALSTLIDFDKGFGYFGTVSLNDSGSIAFNTYRDLVKGIYIGPNPDTDRLVAVGDSFDGSTITDLSLFKKGLNNSGDIAFVATLADGRSGVYIAEPVPEPSSVVLAALAFGCLGLRLRNRLLGGRQ